MRACIRRPRDARRRRRRVSDTDRLLTPKRERPYTEVTRVRDTA